MAAHIPVVCSNVSCMPEIVGEAAITVDPYDEKDIANGTMKVLNDDKLKNDLIQKGEERIKHFSWKESAEKFEKILSEVMEEN